MKKISLGSDHAGFKLKQVIKEYLHQKTGLEKIEINDWGCYSDERCDYPDFAHKVSEDVELKRCDFGILICGSGNGINMSANKWSGVRSAICWKPEIAEMARLHNDANILTLPGRYISEVDAIKCLDIFLQTDFEGGRHLDRIQKIPKNF
jgi:ribose 5-phosphate isomerase B